MPPHLCEQWATELRDKFGIDAAVAQSSKMARLERELPRQDMQVFRHYRHRELSVIDRLAQPRFGYAR